MEKSVKVYGFLRKVGFRSVKGYGLLRKINFDPTKDIVYFERSDKTVKGLAYLKRSEKSVKGYDLFRMVGFQTLKR